MTIELSQPSTGEFLWQLRVEPGALEPAALHSALEAAVKDLGSSDADRGPSQLWIADVDPELNQVACDLGFAPYRDMWQLRIELPAPGQRATMDVQPFALDKDLDDFLEVNRRAFWWHPEQGNVTADDVGKASKQNWFDPAGFLLHRIDGRLVGFCWTKIHHDQTPPIGEIYAIAVEPDFHGTGLGAPLTRAGLDYLADKGLSECMLYVESDNTAANRVYVQLGFHHHRTDRAYRYEP